MGCFWNVAKGCFLVCLLSGFNVFVVCFCVFWQSCKSVKNACFSQFWGAFGGWHILVYLGLEGFGVFVFLVFVFLLFRFSFFMFCSVFVLLLDCFWCCYYFCFGGFFFLLGFLGFVFVGCCLSCFVCVGVFLLCLLFCVVLVCLCFNLCVCWIGLSVVLVLFFWVCSVCVCCVFLCLFLSALMKITVFPAILVFLVYWKKVSLCFSFQFLFLAFCCCFVCFLFQDVPFFGFLLALFFCFESQS